MVALVLLPHGRNLTWISRGDLQAVDRPGKGQLFWHDFRGNPAIV